MTGQDAPPVTHIHSGSHAASFTLDHVWQARELLYFLVWRDIKVRYKHTVLGIAWSILQPLLTMVVFTLFFGRLAKMPSDGVPYPLFSLAALVPWTYFSTAVSNGSASLLGNQHLIAKVYFPRVLVPLAAILMPSVDLMMSLSMLVLMMAFYQVAPTPMMLLLPLYLIIAVLIAFAMALWTSALTIRYRDVRYVLPFAIQIWMFVTPVAYPASLVPERWRLVYALNPMAVVVEGVRSALLGTVAPGVMIPVALVVTVSALVAGGAYFRSVESSIVDLA